MTNHNKYEGVVLPILFSASLFGMGYVSGHIIEADNLHPKITTTSLPASASANKICITISGDRLQPGVYCLMP